MKRSNISAIMSIFLIIALSLSSYVAPIGEPESTILRNTGYQMAPADSYTPHAPINITSDADFDIQGWPGNGSSVNPYIIEGLSITTDAECINITDTTVYFEVKNCILSGGSEHFGSGIVLNNVFNGTIQYCTIYMHNHGIYLVNSNNCKITSNAVSSNSFGFALYDSDYCTLTNNTAFSNLFEGFRLSSSNNCTLTNNTASNNPYYGVRLRSSNNCTLTNNILVDNGLTIDRGSISHWFHDITGNTVNNKPLGYFKSITSTIIDGTQYGQVILANCSKVTVKDGVFTDASVGIELGFCTNCTPVSYTHLTLPTSDLV